MPPTVPVLDDAGWHKIGGEPPVPGNISLLHLPPRSPELRRVENVRATLRGNALGSRVLNTCDDTVDACCTAWHIGTRKRAHVSQ